MHHAFWSCFDEEHPRYVRGGPFETAARDYYRLIDDEVGATLQLLDDATAVFVFSDHGAKRLKGGICLNQWLLDAGYLSLKAPLACSAPLRPEMVDWSRTKAWAQGGHVGRVFANVRGRQPEGIVEPSELDDLCTQLAAALRDIDDGCGNAIDTRVYTPKQLYRECHNVAPDLTVYLGNLDYRALGTLGHASIHVAENDTGSDDANHDPNGLFIGHVPGFQGPPPASMRLIECGRALLQLLT